MQKRRERIERWRAERKKTEQEATRKGTLTVPQAAAKKWSLEDDSEDEDKGSNEKTEKEETVADCEKKPVESEVKMETVEEEDVDPLDEYMKSIFQIVFFKNSFHLICV